MTFHAFGLNHLTTPVTLRERFAMDEPRARAFLASVPLSHDAELVFVSTCNRVEAYLFGTTADATAVRDALSQHAGQAWPDAHSFSFHDEEAVRHVLEVSCGLRSLVLGDAQIFSQVKRAYVLAVEEDRVGTVMHRLLHTAFRTAKRVINETAFGTGGASVSRLAVAAACAHVEPGDGTGLAGRNVLVVGAGKMGGLAVDALLKHDLVSVAVTNRSAERGRAVAEGAGVRFIPWADRYAAVAAADVVIVSTAADGPVLAAEALPARAADAPALLIDISVPRNVDARADLLPGYRVIDMDALGADAAPVEALRRSAVPSARNICDGAKDEFVAWFFHHQALQPAIQAIQGSFEAIRRQEVDRHHNRFDGIDREELDRITKSIIQKLLAIPVVRLKSVEPESVDFVQGIRLLHALFSRPGCEAEAASSGDEGCPAFGEGDGAAGTDAAAVALLREALRSRSTEH